MTKSLSSNPEKEASRLTILWQQHGPNTYPLDLDALIDGAIRQSDFRDTLSIHRRHFDSLEGCLVRTRGTQTWSLLLNEATENKRRQRFTFAHELGHFMCHRYLQERFEDGESSLNDFRSEIEREANLFAAWLLMPANLLRDEFCKQSWTTELLCEIGARFESSLQASALRYVSLSPKPCAFVASRDGMIIWSCRSKTAPFLRAYKFGDELPAGSAAASTAAPSASATTEALASGKAWSEAQCCNESQYFDYSGQGYQYTCIEFTG